MKEHDSASLRKAVQAFAGKGRKVVAGEGLQESFSFSGLLESFVHLEFTEEEAIAHWKGILAHAALLTNDLGRKIGIHLALVDYFTNINHMMDSPMLVEVHVFKQTERLAMVDGLTGVFNRRYMDIVLKKEFNRCDRYGKNLSLCLIDIDNFKNINDTHGHIFGDEVLREISQLVKDVVREEDIVCRYGGEEFLVLLPETDEAGAEILAERIRMTMKGREFFTKYNITFSAGLATYPLSAMDMEGLVMAADRALYQAKFDGKDRAVSASPERRRFGRYPQTWNLNIYPDNEARPITGVITQNVSLGGIQFECPVRYPVDCSIRLVFTSLDIEAPDVEAQARITWAKKTMDGYIYGVSFVDTPEILEAKLESAIGALESIS